MTAANFLSGFKGFPIEGTTLVRLGFGSILGSILGLKTIVVFGLAAFLGLSRLIASVFSGDFALAFILLGDFALAFILLGDFALALVLLGDFALALVLLGDFALALVLLGDFALAFILLFFLAFDLAALFLAITSTPN